MVTHEKILVVENLNKLRYTIKKTKKKFGMLNFFIGVYTNSWF